MEDVPVIKMRRKGKNLEQRMLIPSEKMVVDALRAAQAGRLSALGDQAHARGGIRRGCVLPGDGAAASGTH
ncbi:hypothetical protein FHX09_003742 [Rhizobium sp. BK538]|nr:hypothetical protein [Rhizobium sp. BK538]